MKFAINFLLSVFITLCKSDKSLKLCGCQFLTTLRNTDAKQKIQSERTKFFGKYYSQPLSSNTVLSAG